MFRAIFLDEFDHRYNRRKMQTKHEAKESYEENLIAALLSGLFHRIIEGFWISLFVPSVLNPLMLVVLYRSWLKHFMRLISAWWNSYKGQVTLCRQNFKQHQH